MHYVTIQGVDRPLSRLALGTILFGSVSEEQAFDVLDEFVARGGTTFDTAHVYGQGSIERAFGRWVAARGNRDQIVIIGKGAHPVGKSGPRVNPTAIRSDLDESLERMGIDHVDVYLLHRDDEQVPVGPIVEVLNEQKAKGRIKVFGGSNWRHGRIDEANAYAAAHNLTGFNVSSPNLGLARANEPMWAGCVSVDATELAWYRQTKTPLISWSSQSGGFFTGRYSPDDTSNADMVRVYYSDENWARLERARELAKQKGVDALQIALAYVINQSFPVIALIGPQTRSELASSLGADEIVLTPQEIGYLEGAPATV